MVSPCFILNLLEQKTTFFPSRVNIGKPSKVSFWVILSKPIPSTLMIYKSNLPDLLEKYRSSRKVSKHIHETYQTVVDISQVLFSINSERVSIFTFVFRITHQIQKKAYHTNYRKQKYNFKSHRISPSQFNFELALKL